VDQQRVVDLPLKGRNATDLIYLAGAAVTAPNADLVSAKNSPGEAPISVTGGLATGTTYLLAGGEFNDSLNNLNLPLPFPDALQEFKVETSSLPGAIRRALWRRGERADEIGQQRISRGSVRVCAQLPVQRRNFLATQSDSLKRNQFGGYVGGVEASELQLRAATILLFGTGPGHPF
jgi:hypothetical protein